jgi:aspartate-semialdehyde dehydrogenase
MSSQQKRKVGVLGATGASHGPYRKLHSFVKLGTVGQRFIVLLSNHPLFELAVLGASARSAGKPYAQATRWKQPVPIPANVASLQVHECQPAHFKDCAIVFSGLDSDVAGDVGTLLHRACMRIS